MPLPRDPNRDFFVRILFGGSGGGEFQPSFNPVAILVVVCLNNLLDSAFVKQGRYSTYESFVEQ